MSRLGVHPQNRGGMYPQPDVVRNLGLKIITKGFNQSEANHEGVSVEEIPCSERAAHSRSDGSPYEPYADYNIRQCDHKYLVKCFSQLHDIVQVAETCVQEPVVALPVVVVRVCLVW